MWGRLSIGQHGLLFTRHPWKMRVAKAWNSYVPTQVDVWIPRESLCQRLFKRRPCKRCLQTILAQRRPQNPIKEQRREKYFLREQRGEHIRPDIVIEDSQSRLTWAATQKWESVGHSGCSKHDVYRARYLNCKFVSTCSEKTEISLKQGCCREAHF